MNEVKKFRKKFKKIIFGNKNIFAIILGPCSIHSYLSCKKYSNFVKKNKKKFKNLFLVMRFYVEKPRTIIGWKGFIYDPNLNNSFNIKKGFYYCKNFLKKLKVPIATEFLNPIISDFIKKYITIGSIGARTTESQIHKEISSKYDISIGFKNSTNGNIIVPINSILSSKKKTICTNVCKKKFKIYFIKTKGNKKNFIILRGAKNPNYKINNIIHFLKKKYENFIHTGLIIDLNHDNSKKNYKKQLNISNYLLKKVINFFFEVSGIMIESHIKSGTQIKKKKYYRSITDSCISIKKTFLILKKINFFLNLRKIYY
ncbi:3-deoxy-7-phosphoheptulonate synthase [Candidatus Vidania fulgoroideorum]